jgi:hypothetical protein
MRMYRRQVRIPEVLFFETRHLLVLESVKCTIPPSRASIFSVAVILNRNGFRAIARIAMLIRAEPCAPPKWHAYLRRLYVVAVVIAAIFTRTVSGM